MATTQPAPGADTAQGRHSRLVDAVGVAYFPLALAARLPYAMMVVGVLTLVVAGRDSLTLGGLTSAVTGIGTAVFGPLIGATVDRYGQRRVLFVVGLVNGVALLAMAWTVYAPVPDVVVLLVGLVIGASAPQVGPMSRSRLVAVIGRQILPGRRTSVFHSTMSYESGADEIVFVFGPVIVGALASGVHPAAPLIGAAALTVVFVLAFALHRSASAPTPDRPTPDAPAGAAPSGVQVGAAPSGVPVGAAPSGATTGAASSGAPAVARPTAQAPAAELARPSLLVVVGGVLGIGLLFGSVLTSLTAYLEDLGHAERAGLVYGALGVGSAVLALLAGRFPPGFTLRARLVSFGAVVAAATVVLGIATTLPLVVAAMVLAGIGVGPLLVTGFSLGAMRSPHGRSATVMTMLGSAVVVGQATASAVTGWIADAVGTGVALWAPVAAAAVILASALANWHLTPTRTRIRRRS